MQQHIEGQQMQSVPAASASGGAAPEFIPLESYKQKEGFIFKTINSNLCPRLMNVNLTNDECNCEIFNCKKFHINFRTSNFSYKIDRVFCRYDENCKMNNSHQCKFIHSEQIERWFKHYLRNNNIDMLLKYIFIEIVRSLDRQYKYKAEQSAEKRRLYEIEERRLMNERRRYDDRSETRRDSRERSRSRERERERRYDDRSSYQSRPSLLPPPPPPPSYSATYSATRNDSRLELEKINLEIELAKKKKELLEISKATDSLKTKLDVETMVKSAIASQMQTVAASYPSAYPSQVYQHYGGYAGAGGYSGAGAGGYSGAGAGGYSGAGAGGYSGAGTSAGAGAGAGAGGYDPRFAYDSRSAYTGAGAAYGNYSEY
jgi:hypothetical protein